MLRELSRAAHLHCLPWCANSFPTNGSRCIENPSLASLLGALEPPVLERTAAALAVEGSKLIATC